MAFTPATLVCVSVGAPAGCPNVWTYATADTLATAVAADYFIPATTSGYTNKLAVKDVIHIMAATNGTRAVATSSATACTVAALV